MEPYVLLLIVGVSFLIFLATGTPIVFVLGGLSVVFITLYWGIMGVDSLSYAAFDTLTTPTLLALPLFLFMGNIIRYSGIGEDLFEMVDGWLGGINGGLAMGTVLICTLFAAMVGVAGAATVTMAVVALPAMAKRGYHKHIYVGCIAAGGLLGLLIPPSIEMIVYSTISGVSVGRMYLGGVFPGLIMATLFVLYIGIRCHFNPQLGSARSEKISWGTRIKLLRNISLPGLLVLLILGGIYTGTFTPTEASGIGSAGAIIIAGIKRTLTRKMLDDSCKSTVRLIGMIFWLMIAASCFSQAVVTTKIGPWLTVTLGSMNMPFWIVLLGVMVILMIMGTMMGDLTITLLMVPIATPVMDAIGVDQVWFALLFVINMITAWLTPPYGTSLFLMRLLVPEGVTMGDIYRSVLPFVTLMFFTLLLCAIFPGLVLYLPNLLLGGGIR